jgi:putative spermidine/putrescine transport system substrate-binding protein
MFDGRVWTQIDSGSNSLDFINPAEGGIVSPIVVQKVKNAPDIAWAYVNAMLDPGNQSQFSDVMNYGVTNRKVVYSPKAAARITKWEQTRWPPFEEIGPRVSGWLERWNRELT